MHPPENFLPTPLIAHRSCDVLRLLVFGSEEEADEEEEDGEDDEGEDDEPDDEAQNDVLLQELSVLI